MALLEVFVHRGCPSEARARSVAQEIGTAYSQLQIHVCQAHTYPQRISELGLLILPSFVLNGRLLAVGVPRTIWLMAELQKYDLDVSSQGNKLSLR